MRRREFLALAGATLASPGAALAQQPAMIGFLHSGSPGPFTHLADEFRNGLADSGYVEGKNVTIQYRWAEGDLGRLPALARELAAMPIAVLATAGGEGPALAAKSATGTIPILFVMGRDPASAGLVNSMGRPEGNVTGVMQFTTELASKRLSLLRELVPDAKTIALLVNSRNSNTATQVREAEEAARASGIDLRVIAARVGDDVAAALAPLDGLEAKALVVGADPILFDHRDAFVAAVARRKLPAIYDFREFADAGGLMSYGASLLDAYRQVGRYAGQLLKGAKPAELPVVQSARFELVVNLKAARQLGVDVPPTLLLRADEVIE